MQALSPLHAKVFFFFFTEEYCSVVIYLFSVFISFERESESQGGAERERERENPKQAPHCQSRVRLRAQSHELRDHDLS